MEQAEILEQFEKLKRREKEPFSVESLVIKVGTRSLTKDSELLNEDLIGELARETTELFHQGVKSIIVTSGAVACGRKISGIAGNDKVSRQVAAMYGQPYLMGIWHAAFAKQGIQSTEVLIGQQDLYSVADPLRIVMQQSIPVINANDAVHNRVATNDVITSDNDKLAGFLAQLVSADMLLLLTDVNGILHNGTVEKLIDPDMDASHMIKDTTNTISEGGMRSKLTIAQGFARNYRRQAVIANASTQNVICKAVNGELVGSRITKEVRSYD